MKLLENEFYFRAYFHFSFDALLLSKPNLSQFTTIQSASLQNLNSTNVAS